MELSNTYFLATNSIAPSEFDNNNLKICLNFRKYG
jgi:hypothetical protein